MTSSPPCHSRPLRFPTLWIDVFSQEQGLERPAACKLARHAGPSPPWAGSSLGMAEPASASGGRWAAAGARPARAAAGGELERAPWPAAQLALEPRGTFFRVHEPLTDASGGNKGGAGGSGGGSGSNGGSGRGSGPGSGDGASDGSNPAWLSRLWGMLAMGAAAGITDGRLDLLALLPAWPVSLWCLLGCWDALLLCVVESWVASWSSRPWSRLPSYYPIALPDAVAACAAYLTGAAKGWPHIPSEISGTKLEEAPLTGRPRIILLHFRVVASESGLVAFEEEFFMETLESVRPGKWTFWSC